MRAWIAALGVAACTVTGCDSSADTEAAASETLMLDPETLPAGQCDTEGSSSSTGDACDTDAAAAGSTTGGDDTGSSTAAEPECVVSKSCGSSGVCVADYDPETQQPGPARCEFACVDTLNEDKWCFDDAACCGTARCTDRGYCVADESSQGSTGS